MRSPKSSTPHLHPFAAAIPPLLAGRDVLSAPKPEPAKPLHFCSPHCKKIAAKPTQGKPVIRALVLTPTRELAAQIGDSFDAYSRYLPLRHRVIFGGVNQRLQVADLRRGIDVLVATPGRLLDLHQQGYISLKNVEFFVLDEADRMLDMGFIHDIRRVLAVASTTAPKSAVFSHHAIEHRQAGQWVFGQPHQGRSGPTIKHRRENRSAGDVCRAVEQTAIAARTTGRFRIESAIVFTWTKHGANRGEGTGSLQH